MTTPIKATPTDPSAPDVARLTLERDLFLRLLELGASDDLRPFLADALTLIVELIGATKGYLALGVGVGGDAEASAAPRFAIARGFTDDEVANVRRAMSSGIIAEAIASGTTVSTASALEDPRFREQRSVQSARIEAVLCAPLKTTPPGVLYLAGRTARGPFPEPHRALAELFARHVAPLANRLLEREELAVGVDHTVALRARLRVDAIAGKSRVLADVFRQLAVAAPVPVAVLFTGESGTGKSALARALHDSSPRAAAPFVEVNCGAIPDGLFESELFGAEKGAHSTATRRIEGKIDAARGGTLFLDEVAEMPLAVQSKLLLFLQSKRYYRLGASTPIDADVRVVAATNAALAELVAAKRFREDLYYRLNVLEIRVPPLRDRRDDIAVLADAILDTLGRANDKPVALSRAARLALAEGEWPGNVRQLENVLHRAWAVAVSEGEPVVEPRHLFAEAARANAGDAAAAKEEPATYDDALRAFRARFLRSALDANDWNVSETARRVGVARSHLNDLMRAHGLARAKS